MQREKSTLLVAGQASGAGDERKKMLPARFELAAFGFLFFEQSYSTRYETDVITDYTKEAVGHLMMRIT